MFNVDPMAAFDCIMPKSSIEKSNALKHIQDMDSRGIGSYNKEGVWPKKGAWAQKARRN